MSMSELKSTMEASVNSPERTISTLVSKLNMEPLKQESVSSSLMRNISRERKCVTIDKQYQNLISGFHSAPFMIRVYEDVILIPSFGEFKRFVYKLTVDEIEIDHFHSLENHEKEYLLEEVFSHVIEVWMKKSLNIK